MNVADALVSRQFADGELIIRQVRHDLIVIVYRNNIVIIGV